MNHELKQIFLYLLRLGLWEDYKPKESIHLELEEWKIIYKMACKQTVQGIIFDGIMRLAIEEQPPRNFKIPWAIRIDALEEENKKQLNLIISLKEYFYTQKNLHFQLLKGQSIAKTYKNGLHRICGDLDLWFCSPENVEKANVCMEQIGVAIERGQHHDSNYQFMGTTIEHHSHMITLHNPFFQKKLKKWEWNEYTKKQDNPSPCANLLLQITHILKHQLNEGIGLRQICDLAVSIKNLDINQKELKTLCKTYGVYRWAQFLFSLLTTYIGLPEKDLPFPAKGNPQLLMDEIWESGNFGHDDTRFGERPKGKWESKLYTLRIIGHKTKIFCYYAPAESFWWVVNLSLERIKELIGKTKK